MTPWKQHPRASLIGVSWPSSKTCVYAGICSRAWPPRAKFRSVQRPKMGQVTGWFCMANLRDLAKKWNSYHWQKNKQSHWYQKTQGFNMIQLQYPSKIDLVWGPLLDTIHVRHVWIPQIRGTLAAGEDKAISLRGDACKGEAAGIHQEFLRLRQHHGSGTVLEVGKIIRLWSRKEERMKINKTKYNFSEWQN